MGYPFRFLSPPPLLLPAPPPLQAAYMNALTVNDGGILTDILQLIAFHLATSDFSDGALYPRPPAPLLNLLLTCRSFNYALSPRYNAHLYAEIFRYTFDFAALERRIPAQHLTAPTLCYELRRRWTVLKRIRAQSHAEPYFWSPRRYRPQAILEDLATMYLMFTESDGTNARILLLYAHAEDWLDQYHFHIVEPRNSYPEMPEGGEEDALWLWLKWMTLDYYKSIGEQENERRHFTFLLVPYLLGFFKYAGGYAPWAWGTLPAIHATSPPSSNPLAIVPDLEIRPQSTAIPGGYLGGVDFSPPLVHHAAIHLFFTQVQDRPPNPIPVEVPGVGEEPVPPAATIAPPNELLLQAISQGPFPSVSTLMNADEVFMGRRVPFTPDYMRIQFANIVDSTKWDSEWARMISCRDPIHGRVQGPITSASLYRYATGSLTGYWDGWFMLPNRENHDRLLSSLDPDIDTPEGEVPLNILEDALKLHDVQSWSISEYTYVPSSYCPNPISPIRMDGEALNAHLPTGLFIEARSTQWVGDSWREGVVVRLPHQDLQAFYELSHPTSEPVPAPPGVLTTLIVGTYTTAPTRHAELTPRIMDVGSTMIGTIRHWDGLATIRVNEPMGEPWIYNGYLTDGNWFGRWRTGEIELDWGAYQGVFCMRRRVEA